MDDIDLRRVVVTTLDNTPDFVCGSPPRISGQNVKPQ
jgi:hypothetical protein